jgi:hypothetical protein
VIRSFSQFYYDISEAEMAANHTGDAVKTVDTLIGRRRRKKPVAEANDPSDRALKKTRRHAKMANYLQGHIDFAKKRGDHERAKKYERQQALHKRALQAIARQDD